MTSKKFETIVATGYISGKESGVFAYLSTSANTTCTLADTWYPVSGTFTNQVLENFSAATVVTPGIKYDGDKTQHFEVDIHATVAGDANGITIHIGVYKNGIIEAGSVMGTYMKTAGEYQCISGTCVVSLAEDDEIQLIIKADSAGDVITVAHFTTTITEFFD